MPIDDNGHPDSRIQSHPTNTESRSSRNRSRDSQSSRENGSPPESTNDPTRLQNHDSEQSDTDKKGNKQATVTEDVIWTPEEIVSKVEKSELELFQDQHGEVFAWISEGSDGQPAECHKLRTRAFRAFLLAFLNATDNPPRLSSLKEAIAILELKGSQAEQRELSNRFSSKDGQIFLDLGDDSRNMVTIKEDGWRITKQSEARFLRMPHQRELPKPTTGGNIDEFFDYCPIDPEGAKLLVLAWLVSALCPHIPTPILLIVGPPGSAKTTRTRRLKSLIDPSVLSVLGDLETGYLFQTFQHHALPCFENVSKFSRKAADMFCRAVTGNGVERRRLYTDSDQVLYSFRRPIIINGIDPPSSRPDFLDRCIFIHCQRLGQFQQIQELDQRFEEARPRLLGALLDLTVKVLELLPQTETVHRFRMADFANLGRAVARGLGKVASDFDAAFQENVREQDSHILEDSPMLRLLKKLVISHTKSSEWEGTADDLLRQLSLLADMDKDAQAKRDLPKSARWMSSRLAELTSALLSMGIVAEKLPRESTFRKWKLSNTVSQVEIENVTNQIKEKQGDNNNG